MEEALDLSSDRILNEWIMKIMSKSPSRQLVRLQGKLKPKKKKYLHIRKFYYIFQYFNVLVSSRFQWLI